MARREAPCTTTWGSSLDSDVDKGASVDPDAVGIAIESEIEAVSIVVVRCGAASVGAANVPCRGDGRIVVVTAVMEGALVWVDRMDAVSEAGPVGAVGVESSMCMLVGRRLGGAGFKMEIPSVPKTLLEVLRRASRRVGTGRDGSVSEGRGFLLGSSGGEGLGLPLTPHHVPIQSPMDGRS